MRWSVAALSALLLRLCRVFVWREAFPQFSADYGRVLASIEGLERTLPFFYYAGAAEDGLRLSKSRWGMVK